MRRKGIGEKFKVGIKRKLEAKLRVRKGEAKREKWGRALRKGAIKLRKWVEKN